MSSRLGVRSGLPPGAATLAEGGATEGAAGPGGADGGAPKAPDWKGNKELMPKAALVHFMSSIQIQYAKIIN